MTIHEIKIKMVASDFCKIGSKVTEQGDANKKT